MDGKAGSIAATPATWQKGLVAVMPREQMEREARYQASMCMFRSLWAQGILSREDYREAERMMREKYNPALGTLFSDISLT